jgi:hypothetical protein
LERTFDSYRFQSLLAIEGIKTEITIDIRQKWGIGREGEQPVYAQTTITISTDTVFKKKKKRVVLLLYALAHYFFFLFF